MLRWHDGGVWRGNGTYVQERRGWRFAVDLGCHLGRCLFFGMWHRELLEGLD